MSQIFKRAIPIEIINNFFEKYCISVKQYYVFNKDCYKKLSYNGQTELFLSSCQDYYHSSKQKYLQNTSFNGITTIIRQICNYHQIPFTSKLKYAHSTYTIEYVFGKR
jgi:hypothetical protein